MDEALAAPTLAGLSSLDLAVLAVSLLIMLLIGWAAGRAERTTRSFFLGGRGIPGWAACLSFVATEISAMTIVGVPADSCRANWNYAQFFIGSAAARVFVAYLFIPAFFSCECTSIYEYLRGRFGAGTQYCATGFFFLARLLGSGVRLYVASMAVSHILDWPLWVCILGFSVIGIAFISYGGIRAVIWTNVFQALIFIGAGFAVLGFLQAAIPGGLPGVLAGAFPIGDAAAARAAASAIPEAKTVFLAAAESGSRVPYFLNLTWDTGSYAAGSLLGILHAIFASPVALWVGVLSGFTMSVASFGTDQENIQRLLTVETRQQSQRMICWTVLASGGVLLTYLAIGSGLAVWFAAHPEAGLPPKTDDIFPYFISHVLPHGLRGLLLSAIVMASIDSPLASLTTCAITDLYKPLVRPDAEDSHYLRLSRIGVVVFGVILGYLALAFSRFDQILFVGFKISGVACGSLLGVFLYGLMTRRQLASRPAVLGMIVNGVAMAVLLLLIERKVIWLAWSWLPLLGTFLTMVLMQAFALASTAAAVGTSPAVATSYKRAAPGSQIVAPPTASS